MNKFYSDRDSKGAPLESSPIQLFTRKNIPAWYNPAPETDLQGRRAYDIGLHMHGRDIGIECKMDWASLTYGNICIEEKSLEHSKADFFVYGFPQVVVFTPQELRELAQFGRRVIAGDQDDNYAYVVRKGLLKGQIAKDGTVISKPFGTNIYNFLN